MVESLLTGLLGTAVGIAFGVVVTSWIVHSLLADTFPDLGAEMALTSASIAMTLAVGIVAVTLAPLFTFRRLREMDIPSTLRVVE
jgi:ABC-type antimicrobial peptide transport system permease subunit